MKTIGGIIKWTALVLVIIVLGGCAAIAISLGKSSSDAQEKADNYAQVENQIKMGMTEAQVVALAGEPENRQENSYESEGVQLHTVYLYYGVLSENSVQLVFEDDSLRAINKG